MAVAPPPNGPAEAVARFARSKVAADLGTILPMVAGPALGTYFGRKLMAGRSGAGELLGSIAGGVAGKYMGDAVAERNRTPQASGAPYAVDPTMQDIPEWALSSARYLQQQPQFKQGNHEGVKDVILGDTLGSAYPFVDALKTRDWGGAARQAAGQTAGVAGGGLLGYGAGHLMSHLLGRDVNVPGVNIPLSTILSGLGATIGGVKGLQYARGQG